MNRIHGRVAILQHSYIKFQGNLHQISVMDTFASVPYDIEMRSTMLGLQILQKCSIGFFYLILWFRIY
jgi:hypothetical protein